MVCNKDNSGKGEDYQEKVFSDKLASHITPEGIETFMASKWVEGIGKVYAGRLIDKFGVEAVTILEASPELAESVPGLGKARIKEASESIARLPYPTELIVFLFSCGLKEIDIEKILGKYRKQAVKAVTEDPYNMEEDVWRFSFFSADKIGRQLGISSDDPRRLRGALLAAVRKYADDGHLFATREQAVKLAATLAKEDPAKIEREVKYLVDSGRLIESRGGLYIPVYYKAEKEVAERLSNLATVRVDGIGEIDIPLVSEEGHKYSEPQRKAIQLISGHTVSVLTGGPGSGKTTVLKGVLDVLAAKGLKVLVTAPTGRAAKRAAMLTGTEATTIHRLLGYRKGQGYHNKTIDADVIVIDESSMLEQVMLDHLLHALKPDARVIIVGDADQLPAIGAGDVLRDLIDSGTVPIARLSENFRQEEGSRIASNARAINEGEIPESDSGSDFMIIEANTVKEIHNRIIYLITKKIPELYGLDPAEIQVVSPQQIGPLGARQLNIDLQEAINPDGPFLTRGQTVIRLGDPVMQTANSSDRGLYNGEVGRVVDVAPEKQTLTVEFADGRRSSYARCELSELTLAYATTVHKLQGSEVKYMIFPVTMAHKPMLYRNLLYTGVSRATRLCVLVGEKEAIRYAVENIPDSKRNSNFKYRLREK